MTKKNKIVENKSEQTDINKIIEIPIVNETISEEQKEEMMTEGTNMLAEEINNNNQEDLIGLGEEQLKETEPEIEKEYIVNISTETTNEELTIDTFPVEDVKNLNENSGVTVEEELQKMIVEEKPVRTIASLSKSEYREYQRTGNLPK